MEISRFRTVLALIILSFVFMTGCTTTQIHKADPRLENLPDIEKINLNAGVYYSPQLIQFNWVQYFGSAKGITPIGKDSISVFDTICPMIFQQCTLMGTLPPYLDDKKNIDLVLVPQIEYFNPPFGFNYDPDAHFLTYRITLYSLTGIPFSSFIVKGEMNESSSAVTPTGKMIDDAAKNLLKNFKKISRLELLSQIESGKDKQQFCSAAKDINIEAKLSNSRLELAEEGYIPFLDLGIIPIEVKVTNSCASSIFYDVSNSYLELETGEKLNPTSNSLLVNTIVEQREYGSDAAAILFGPLVGLAASAHEGSARNEKAALLAIKIEDIDLDSSLIPSGDSKRGLFFLLPYSDNLNFESAKIVSWLSDGQQTFIKREEDVSNIGFANKGSLEKKNLREVERISSLPTSVVSPGPKSEPAKIVAEPVPIGTLAIQTSRREVMLDVTSAEKDYFEGYEIFMSGQGDTDAKLKIYYSDIEKIDGKSITPQQIREEYFDRKGPRDISEKVGTLSIVDTDFREIILDVSTVGDDYIEGTEILMSGQGDNSSKHRFYFNDIYSINGKQMTVPEIRKKFSQF